MERCKKKVPSRLTLKNKVIGTRGQGVRLGCPRELTTEHLTEASLGAGRGRGASAENGQNAKSLTS